MASGLVVASGFVVNGELVVEGTIVSGPLAVDGTDLVVIGDMVPIRMDEFELVDVVYVCVDSELMVDGGAVIGTTVIGGVVLRLVEDCELLVNGGLVIE